MKYLNKLTVFILLLAAPLIVACGEQLTEIINSSNADEDELSQSISDLADSYELEESVPEDSTGQIVAVSLKFFTPKQPEVNLRLNDPIENTSDPDGADAIDNESESDGATSDSDLSIGNIAVEYAKFNIAAIKIKAPKKQTEVEKALDDLEKMEDKELAKFDNQEIFGDDKNSENSAALNQDIESRRQQARNKIKERKGRFKEEAKKRYAKAAKRDRSVKWEGPYVFDAVKGALENDASAVSLKDGSYKRIEFKLKKNTDASEDEALLGNVFAIAGKCSDETPFAISWHRALNFRLRGDNAFKATDDDDTNELLIVFNLAEWFETVDICNGSKSNDGTIYIDKLSNRPLMKVLHRAMKKSIYFGKDKDADGTLETEEIAGTGDEEAADNSEDELNEE